jgi:hypothetical protein
MFSLASSRTERRGAVLCRWEFFYATVHLGKPDSPDGGARGRRLIVENDALERQTAQRVWVRYRLDGGRCLRARTGEGSGDQSVATSHLAIRACYPSSTTHQTILMMLDAIQLPNMHPHTWTAERVVILKNCLGVSGRLS